MVTYTSKEHIIAAIKRGVRLDGRKPTEFRKLTIKVGTLATAEGSAHVRCGDTEILAGIKMALGTPYADTPDTGVLSVGAELLPISNPNFEAGPPTTESIELARVIDRGIRESKTIDDHALCIEAGKQVWMVNIDLCPLNTDGNLIDIGAIAAIAALKNARFPALVDGKVDYHKKTDKKLPVNGTPIPVTVIKVGDLLVIDPTDDELSIADSRLTVTTEEDGKLCSLQKGGDGSLTIDDVRAMIELATEKAKEIREIIKESV